MTLISVLLGIAADRLWSQLHEYRHYNHLLSYFDWVRNRFSASYRDHIGGLLLVLFPLWLLVALLQLWISDWLFGLVGLLFYVATFLYCLGPRDLAVDVETWCDVSDSGDSELKQRAAARLLGDEPVPEDPQACARALGTAVLVEANDRLFAVLFWFVLLGPLGAVLYRSGSVLYRERYEEGEFGDSLAWLHSVLVWLPARLLALGYALSGHFDAAIDGWRSAHEDRPTGVEGSERILAITGTGAMGLQQDIPGDAPDAPARAAMRLVWRTLTIWLVVIAILTLAGWAG